MKIPEALRPSHDITALHRSVAAHRAEAAALHGQISLLNSPTPRLRDALEDAEAAARVLRTELRVARCELSSVRAELELELVRSARYIREREAARAEARGMKARMEQASAALERQTGGSKIRATREDELWKRVREEEEMRGGLEQKVEEGLREREREKEAMRMLKAELEHERREGKELGRSLAQAAEELTSTKARLERAENDVGLFSLPPSSLPTLAEGEDGERRAEDVASESRSRFTDTLPFQEAVNSMDADVDEPWAGVNQDVAVTVEVRGRKQIRGAKQSADTRKRRRLIPDSEKTDSVDLGDVLITKAAARKVPVSFTKRPQKARVKTSAPTKSAPNMVSTSPRPVVQERIVGGRQLRSRRPVSYDYNLEGRDIVNASPGYEVDQKALRKKLVMYSPRGRKLPRSEGKRATVDSDDEPLVKRKPAKVVRKTVGG